MNALSENGEDFSRMGNQIYQDSHPGLGRAMDHHQQGYDNADQDTDFNIPYDGEDESQGHQKEVCPSSHPTTISAQQSLS